MCGRFTLTTTNEELMHRFALKTEQNYPNRWNIAPSQTSLTLTQNRMPENTISNLSLNTQDRFGVWQSNLAKRIINARSETLSEKPLFKEAFKHQRCLVLASGWYEWDAEKTPYYISLKDSRVMAFAGLRFNQGEQACFVIVTAAAKGNLARLHHRTPLLLQRKYWQHWLGKSQSIEDECLDAAEGHFFKWHKVSKAVGNVANDNASLILPNTEQHPPLLL